MSKKYTKETYIHQTINAMVIAQAEPINEPILTDGNLKYKRGPLVEWLIFNLPALATCPFACNGCKESCYARKAEKRFPEGALVSRYKNYFLSLRDDFVDIMVKKLRSLIESKRSRVHNMLLRKGGKVIMRVHESGDFYSREYLMKWLEIARQVPEIQFVVYTKSFAFFDGIEELPENFRSGLNCSVWEDMPIDQKADAYALAERFECRVYTALWETTEKALKHGCTESLENTTRRFAKCTCKDCGTCGICWKSRLRETIVAIH